MDHSSPPRKNLRHHRGSLRKSISRPVIRSGTVLQRRTFIPLIRVHSRTGHCNKLNRLYLLGNLRSEPSRILLLTPGHNRQNRPRRIHLRRIRPRIFGRNVVAVQRRHRRIFPIDPRCNHPTLQWIRRQITHQRRILIQLCLDPGIRFVRTPAETQRQRSNQKIYCSHRHSHC